MRTLIFLISMFMGAQTQAHEFWISPTSYQIALADLLQAHIRVGQNFKGGALSYLPEKTERFDVYIGDTRTEVASKIGDRPALSQPNSVTGLAIVVHETADQQLRYSEWQKFVNFTQHKDFADAQIKHKERGLPDTGFIETYRRFGKALIAVGDGKGADIQIGLETEIIALANPYTDPLPDGLPVLVMHQGKPRVSAQVEIFEKSGGAVNVFTRHTNAKGIAIVPVKPGSEYLLDAVVLRDTGNDDPNYGAVWQSLWASLTFKMPET